MGRGLGGPHRRPSKGGFVFTRVHGWRLTAIGLEGVAFEEKSARASGSGAGARRFRDRNCGHPGAARAAAPV